MVTSDSNLPSIPNRFLELISSNSRRIEIIVFVLLAALTIYAIFLHHDLFSGIISAVLLVLLFALTAVNRYGIKKLHAELSTKNTLIRNSFHQCRIALHSMQFIFPKLQANLAPKELALTVNDLKTTMVSLVGIVDNIITYDKLFTRSLAVQKTEVEIRKVVQDIVDIQKYPAENRNITLTLIIAEGLPEKLITGKEQLGNILSNLISNAIRYSQHNGAVSIRIGLENNNIWTIVVEDNGDGISSKIRETLFEPYKTTYHKGTGLGLPIVKNATKMLGGKISYQSEEGVGTIFTVSFPLELSQSK